MSAAFSVLFFSSLDWDFRKQDQQVIALSLAEARHPVLYVENTGARMPGLRDLARIRHRFARLMHSASPVAATNGVDVVTPLVIPGGSSAVERRLNRLLLRRTLRPHLARLGCVPLVMWISLPTWTAVDIIDEVRPDVVVYYCGDMFSRIPGVRPGILESERMIIRRADVVFATSQVLADRCASLGAKPTLVPVVTDIEASDPARRGETATPGELTGLGGRIIGYMGGLNHKVDVALLDRVATAFPSDTLVVLGSVEDPAFRPRVTKNVVVLGERTYAEIAAYLVRFDVCLIPYLLNDFTVGVYPAKLLEYLSVGRPVVSTPLPEVLRFSGVVRIAADHDAFIRAVGEVLNSAGGETDRLARMDAVIASTLDATANMLDQIERAVESAPRLHREG